MSKKTFGADTYAKGENPNGCISQTPDETMRNYKALPEQEYKYRMEADGPRWNSGFAPQPEPMSVPQNPRRRRR